MRGSGIVQLFGSAAVGMNLCGYCREGWCLGDVAKCGWCFRGERVTVCIGKGSVAEGGN